MTHQQKKEYLIKEFKQLAEQGYMNEKECVDAIEALDHLNAVEMNEMARAFQDSQ